jgi:hypothetical protein
MARNHCRLPGVFGSWCARAFDHGKTTDTNGSDDDPDLRPFDRSDQKPDPARVLSLCFQRLVNFDGDVFERLGREMIAVRRNAREQQNRRK